MYIENFYRYQIIETSWCHFRLPITKYCISLLLDFFLDFCQRLCACYNMIYGIKGLSFTVHVLYCACVVGLLKHPTWQYVLYDLTSIVICLIMVVLYYKYCVSIVFVDLVKEVVFLLMLSSELTVEFDLAPTSHGRSKDVPSPQSQHDTDPLPQSRSESTHYKTNPRMVPRKTQSAQGWFFIKKSIQGWSITTQSTKGLSVTTQPTKGYPAITQSSQGWFVTTQPTKE